MSVVGWLLLLAVLIVVGIYAERALARRRGVTPLTQPLTAGASTVRKQVSTLGKRAVQSPHELHTDAFRAWVRTQLPQGDPLRGWLLNLPGQSFTALTIQLGKFLDELNIELRWLVDCELEADPQLQQAVAEMVLGFCRACMEATSVQSDLAQVRRYAEALSRLTERQSRDLTRRLLVELREQQLAPETAPEILLATDSERRVYVRQLVEQANEKDRARFQQIFTRILADETNTTSTANGQAS
jgi:hypothetical protein